MGYIFKCQGKYGDPSELAYYPLKVLKLFFVLCFHFSFLFSAFFPYGKKTNKQTNKKSLIHLLMHSE